MGLFDGYQFNPQSYGGGLLERLGMMPNVPLNLPGNGFGDQPTSTYGHGGVQVPVFGQPDPAAIPQNAQPAQYQAPQQGGNPLMAGLQGFGEGGRSGGLIGALTGAASGFSNGETRQNQTVRALTSAGLAPDMAAMVARDPGLLRAVMPQLMGTGGQTSDIKEYQFAKGQGFKGTLEDWMQRKRAGAGEYSLTPVYGTNEKGETVLLQPGKSGTAIETKLPPGVKISSGVEKIDLGTQWGLYDKRTGNLVGFQQKDIRGKEREEAVGKGEGEAAVSLESVKSKMPGLEKVVGELDKLSNDATYTLAGQGVNFIGRQLGMEPREAAVARSQYISMVDNQVLPLLRDTFGAAFTQKEGETLRNTLGDPDKSPKEKQAILKSFIEQKRRDVEALEKRVSGAPASKASAPGTDLRKKYGLE